MVTYQPVYGILEWMRFVELGEISVRRAWAIAGTTVVALSSWVIAAPPVALAVGYTCDGQPATIVGTAEVDSLVGTPGADVIVGLGGKDTIAGLGGDDRLCGGRGVDIIDAGGGDDTVYGGADGFAVFIEGDFIEGGPGDDQLHGGLDPAESGGQQKNEDILIYEDAPRGIRINLDEPAVTGQGHDTIDGFFSVIGSEHDDVITAGAETDVVKALGGDDTITVDSQEGEVFGGDGNDVMRGCYYAYGNHGDDDIRFALEQASGGNGDDVMVGTKHRDIMRGGTGRDVIRGRQGRDFLDGQEGSDRILGGGRDDLVLGGPQADWLAGGRGDDQLEAGDINGRHQGKHAPVADDRLRGGPGVDTVAFPDVHRRGGVRVDLAQGLATHVGRDRLIGIENVWGTRWGDQIFGDSRRNVLSGNGGDDHLVGRGRIDKADGAEGTDRCDAEVELSCEQ